MKTWVQLDPTNSISVISIPRHLKLKTISLGSALQSFTIGWNSFYFELFFVSPEGSCTFKLIAFYSRGPFLKGPEVFKPRKLQQKSQTSWLQSWFLVSFIQAVSLHVCTFLFKVHMKWKIISAYLKDLSKYRMAFSFLKYLFSFQRY